MPAEKRRRLDKERPSSRLRQHLAERRQQGTIGRPQARAADLAPQHLKLMPQHEDLDLLRPLRTTKENEKLEQAADHPVSEGKALKQQTPRTHPPTLSPRKTRRPAHPFPIRRAEPQKPAREFMGPTRRQPSRSIAARGSTAQPHCPHESTVMVTRERDQGGVALHRTLGGGDLGRLGRYLTDRFTVDTARPFSPP